MPTQGCFRHDAASDLCSRCFSVSVVQLEIRHSVRERWILFRWKHFASVCVCGVNANTQKARQKLCELRSAAPSAGETCVEQESKKATFALRLKLYGKTHFTWVDVTPPLLLSTYKASDNIPSAFQNITLI